MAMPKKRDALAVVPTDLAQQWATRINRQMGAAVEAILETGRELIAAKAALKHGGWERMFAGHAQAVREPVPFTVSTAKRFMLIAENKALVNRAHAHALPPSWMTLYELTKLDPPMLEAALADGRIHPGMERRDVAALREPDTQERQIRAAWTMAEANDRLGRAIEAETDRWGCPQSEYHVLAYLLRTFAASYGKETA